MAMNVKEFIISPKTTLSETIEVALTEIAFGYGEYEVVSKSPLSLCLSKRDGRLVIEGDSHVSIKTSCDLCCKDVTLDFSIEIRRSIPIIDGELSECDDEDSTLAFEGFELETDRMVFDEIIEHWPMKILCHEDCKGLCTVCGKDLNEGDCGCDTFVPDPRMAGFLDILNSMDD